MNIKPVILLTNLNDEVYNRNRWPMPVSDEDDAVITQNIYDKHIENKRYIQLGENKLLSESKYNDIKFYNKKFKKFNDTKFCNTMLESVEKNQVKDKTLFNLINVLILIRTVGLNNYNERLFDCIQEISKYFISNIKYL